MKLKEKLKKDRIRALWAYLVVLLTVVYFLMTIVKGLYLWTDGSDLNIANDIHSTMSWIMAATWIYPVSSIWQSIPALSFEGDNIFSFYKVIVPPAVIVGACTLFISDYLALRTKFYELKAEVEKEIALREMRQEAGLEGVSENATVDVVINNATNNDPAWHDTWWGRIFIGVAIALIVTAVGIN